MGDREELEKAQAEAHRRLVQGNALMLPEPQSVESTTSKAAAGFVARLHRTPEQIAADAESAERKTRVGAWYKLGTKIGDRYAACDLTRWKYHGTPDQQSRQRQVIAQAQQYQQQLPERVQGGSGMLLFGPPGTGKDFIASALMRTAVLSHGFRIDWANGVDLFSAIRDAIGGEMSERRLVSQWVVPQVLVLSDPLPPRGPLTDFQAGVLFRIVDQRYRARRPTWVTLNVAKRDEAEDRLGTQVVSRLFEGSMVCRCEWQDFRSVVHKTGAGS